MLSVMSYEAVPSISGVRMGVNYGFDRVRFMAPVKNGARVRARFSLKAFNPVDADRTQIVYTVTMEIEGESKPAIAAEWIAMVWGA